jgi:hypothetical protein
MDVLIMLDSPPAVQGSQILVNCSVAGRFPDGTPVQFSFSIPYTYGATLAQKQAAVIAGAKAAAEGIYGKVVPAGSRVEIFGL